MDAQYVSTIYGFNADDLNRLNRKGLKLFEKANENIKKSLPPLHMNKKFKKVYPYTTRVFSLRYGLFLIFSVFMSTLFLNESASAQDKSLVVRMAKLQIDPAQLESYKAALKEEIEASVSIEPGVLTLYAVSEKDNPAHITIFEIYANTDAYKGHLETTHFKKYKSTTKDMVKSLELVDVSPVALVSKPRGD